MPHRLGYRLKIMRLRNADAQDDEGYPAHVGTRERYLSQQPASGVSDEVP